MKNYKAEWPQWLMDAVTEEKAREFTNWLGDVRLADVRWGDVRWGDLRLADVRWGDVRWDDVRLGDVRWGDVRWGDVRLGDVRLGDVRWGDVRLDEVRWDDVRLDDVRLDEVRLGDVIWQDYFDVLWRVPAEVGGLIAALKAGKVDGSAYTGKCACLCGTIAHLKHCNYEYIPGVIPDSSRPIERFFLSIREGSTPENNLACAVAVRWAQAFQELAAANQPKEVPCPPLS